MTTAEQATRPSADPQVDEVIDGYLAALATRRCLATRATLT